MKTKIEEIIQNAFEKNKIETREKIISIEDIEFNKEQIGSEQYKVGNFTIYKEDDTYSAYFNCRLTIEGSANMKTNGTGIITDLKENDLGDLTYNDSIRVSINKL
ncbi:MAG: hypothetical protein RIC95_10685 [Vicingaceae bacterium]